MTDGATGRIRNDSVIGCWLLVVGYWLLVIRLLVLGSFVLVLGLSVIGYRYPPLGSFVLVLGLSVIGSSRETGVLFLLFSHGGFQHFFQLPAAGFPGKTGTHEFLSRSGHGFGKCGVAEQTDGLFRKFDRGPGQ